ncbi:MAG TPA: hypothetical protein VMV19_16205 [Xanthobacteraceae bacterium]|nr:hypothetical protein [Xanthobacteraceae bacterium]
MIEQRPTLLALIEVIERSQIVLRRRPDALPAGFGDVDAAILAWIAAEGRRIGRGYALM